MCPLERGDSMGGDWDGWKEKNVSAKSIPLNRDCIHALCQLSVPHCVHNFISTSIVVNFTAA